MPRYLIEREVGEFTQEELEETSRLSKRVLEDMPDVVWVKSYVSVAEGKIYCEYFAPNPEAVLEHARRVGIPADKISEISLEISPDMFV